MRGRAAFEETRALLAERGLVEDQTQPYTGESFGSWLIAVSGEPRLRIVWDGRDGWAIIQGERLRRGESEWEDLWIGKRPEDLTPGGVVTALERLRDIANEARASHS